MMTPVRFAELYHEEWTELERGLDALSGRQLPGTPQRSEVSGARVALLYRRTCEHLALARARAYPTYLVDRLEALTARAHQMIYQQREVGLARLRRLVAYEFPAAVRQQRRYVAVAAATFLVPTLVLGLLVYAKPELILSVVNANQVQQFEEMYSVSAESIGRTRTASTDWMMFGFYIRNNIGVAFQCFAGGLVAGLGSLFALAYNGAMGGAVAGYLTAQGMSSTFWPFVATHSSFELTAIVLAGAAGLRIGHALLSPGRLTRSQALVHASREAAVLLYGVTFMLVVAAVLEAFWSSSQWVSPAIKYTAAACCWTAVMAYFFLQGRRAR